MNEYETVRVEVDYFAGEFDVVVCYNPQLGCGKSDNHARYTISQKCTSPAELVARRVEHGNREEMERRLRR
jgi:hypothetical protein